MILVQYEYKKFGGRMSNYSNDNNNLSDTDLNAESIYFDCLKDIRNGKYKSYLTLAKIYEEGRLNINQNFSKAMEYREKFMEEHRKLTPIAFDPIAFVIETGNKYLENGNKYKAADKFIEASLLIHEVSNEDEELRNDMMNEYKLEELIKETE